MVHEDEILWKWWEIGRRKKIQKIWIVGSFWRFPFWILIFILHSFFTSLLIRTVRSAGVDDYSDSLCFFRKIYKNVCSGPFILSFHYDFYSVLTTLFIIDHRLTNNGYFWSLKVLFAARWRFSSFCGPRVLQLVHHRNNLHYHWLYTLSSTLRVSRAVLTVLQANYSTAIVQLFQSKRCIALLHWNWWLAISRWSWSTP